MHACATEEMQGRGTRQCPNQEEEEGRSYAFGIKRVQEMIVAVVASKSPSSSPKRIHFARGDSKA